MTKKTEIVKRSAFGDLAAAGEVSATELDALSTALAETMADAGGGGGDGILFASYSGKMRKYSVGREKDEFDAEQQFIVDPRHFTDGWVCWKGGKVVSRHEWLISDRATRAVDEGALKDYGPYNVDGEGWSRNFGFKAFAADDPEYQVQFSTNSNSGRNSLQDLVNAVNTQIKAEEPCVPVITFEDEEFFAQGQWNGKPVFPIAGWLRFDEAAAVLTGAATVEEILDGADEEADIPAPEPKTRRGGGQKKTSRRRAA